MPPKTLEEENSFNAETWEEQAKFFKSYLEIMVKRLSNIKDFWNPEKKKHKLAVIFLFGLFMFVYQYSSRGEATKELTRPQLLENLSEMFPELETMPHGDTVKNVLEKIEVENIEEEMQNLVKKLIKNKKFARYLVDKQYLIAIDGVNAYSRDYKWNDHCIHKEVTVKDGDKKIKKTVFYLYFVESYLVFQMDCVFHC